MLCKEPFTVLFCPNYEGKVSYEFDTGTVLGCIFNLGLVESVDADL